MFEFTIGGGWREWMPIMQAPVGIVAFIIAPILLMLVAMATVLLFIVSAGIYVGMVFAATAISLAILAVVLVPELGPCAFTVVVSAEATPPGRFNVLQLSPETAEDDPLLLHSMSYTHPLAIGEIAKWIAEMKPTGKMLVVSETVDKHDDDDDYELTNPFE